MTVKSRETKRLPVAPSSRQNFIFGTGEMARLTRAFDWSETPVGPIDHWPDTLLVTVNTLLSSRHPMFLWWGKELVQFYNDAYRPSIGADKHPSALGNRAVDCWPEIWPTIGPQIHAVMTGGQATWHQDQLVPIYRDGKLEDVYWTYGYSPVRDPRGVICGTLVVCTETTGRVQAEKRLRTSQEQYKALFELASEAILIADKNGHIHEANLAASRLLGYSRAELLESNYSQLVAKSEIERLWSVRDLLLKGAVSKEEWQLITRDGATLIAQVSATILPDGRWQVFARDVTENKRAERTLIQTEKLAAVGRLASSIAHEINNPLESVTNLLYLARQSAISPESKEYLEIADRELRRVSVIANQTLRFHKQSSNPRLSKCEELIVSALSIYQGRLVNSRVQVHKRTRARSPIRCFEGEIRQVLSNLISNAIDAMHPAGGRLFIHSREATHWKTGRKGLVITVADTGSGMSPATTARIFEPFFTTKDIGGTGLGLWVSHEIIERHGGALTVRSSQKKEHSGTVFTLFLPFDAAVPSKTGP